MAIRGTSRLFHRGIFLPRQMLRSPFIPLSIDWRPWRPLPWAPHFGIGSPPPGTPAISRLDRIAKMHDEEFDRLGLAGWKGLLSPRAARANARMMLRIAKEPYALFPPAVADPLLWIRKQTERIPLFGPWLRWWRNL